MAKPRKPKSLRKPKRPKSRTIAAMNNFISKVKDLERKNKAREAEYKRDLVAYEKTKREFERI